MPTCCLLLFLLIGIIPLNNVNSEDIQRCSKPCGANDKEVFKVGHTYVYNYHAHSFSYVNLTNQEQLGPNNSTLKLSAEIDLHILSQCHLVMKIFNASLQGVDDGKPVHYKNFTDSLVTNEVRLYYSNGLIKELCAVETEPTWVLNIKRGILSMLQFDLQSTTSNTSILEDNIWGLCKTNYTFGEVEGWKTLKKKKTYKDCLQWNGDEIFRSNSLSQKYYEAIDLFKNIQVCKYVLGNMNQPVQVTCKERQKFHPHASKVSMAVSNITQNLDLDRVIIKEFESNVTDLELVYKNMMFEFPNEKNNVDLRNLQDFLDQTIKMYESEFNDFMTSHSFNALVRNASFDVLMNVFTVFETQYKPYLRDMINAILRAKSTNTMKMVVYLHKRRTISDYELIMWMKSLPFVKYPSSQLLNDSKMFMKIEEAELALSGLVLNFCRNTPNCTDDENVRFFINHWDNILKTHLKYFNQKGLTKMLLAIGNTGITNMLPAIGEIITKQSYPTILRLTAIETLRKMPCSKKTKYFLDAFRKWTDNAEVRISAYLALCKCPSDEVLHHILVSFNIEGINEVTTFIWDHFSNSKTLPNEWTANITQLVQDNFLRAEHMTYIPNHAKYIEYYNNFSVFNATTELIGVNVYQNTLPWSSYVKLSFGLFGNDIDKIEIISRVRDINGMIDALFPRKYTTTEDDKYSSENSINDNLIAVEDKLLQPLTEYKYLQSGYITTRIFDVDINVANPFNVSYDLLEIIRQSSNLFKSSFDFENFGKTNVTFQFPTSVGYLLDFNVCWRRNAGLTLSKFEQNYKANPSFKYDVELSTMLSMRNVLQTTISHDAFVKKMTTKSEVVFDIQAQLKVEALLEESKIRKFLFHFDPKLSDNQMFNITSRST